MNKVKSFKGSTIEDLEKKIDEWIEETGFKVISVSHCYAEDEYSVFSALIVYEYS